MKRFHELDSVHEALEERFHQHQILLVEGATGEAMRQLETFERVLERHANEEELYVFPVFTDLVGSAPGGDAEVFRGEHRKILQELALLWEAVEAYNAQPASGALIALLEREMRFKSLLSHHFLREASVLFPALDRAADEPTRTRILAHLTGAGEAFPEAPANGRAL